MSPDSCQAVLTTYPKTFYQEIFHPDSKRVVFLCPLVLNQKVTVLGFWYKFYWEPSSITIDANAPADKAEYLFHFYCDADLPKLLLHCLWQSNWLKWATLKKDFRFECSFVEGLSNFCPLSYFGTQQKGHGLLPIPALFGSVVHLAFLCL